MVVKSSYVTMQFAFLLRLDVKDMPLGDGMSPPMKGGLFSHIVHWNLMAGSIV